jgi:hypothetical protein
MYVCMGIDGDSPEEYGGGTCMYVCVYVYMVIYA